MNDLYTLIAIIIGFVSVIITFLLSYLSLINRICMVESSIKHVCIKVERLLNKYNI